MRSDRILPFVLTSLVVTALLASAPLKAPAAERRPNVLFIITDQQFADAMSCRMGKQFLNTPAMDRLARAGTLFTRAYSSNPLCMPWRASVFTGHYPHQTGVTQNAPPPAGFDPQEFVSLGACFRNAGYDAAYSGKWHLCYNVKDTNTHGFEMLTGKGKENHDAGVADGAVKFLARPHDKPFVLVASFLNPHNICEWARRLAGREQVLNCGEIGAPPPLEQLPPLPANLAPPKNEPDGMALMRRAYQVESGPFPVGKFTTEDWRKQRWGYYRMIELVDAEMGKVLAALSQAGLEENTLIVFTSDHGETTDLATDPKYREVVLQHREMLRRFGQEHNDPLVAELLADNVKPIPFTAENSPPKASLPKKAKLDKTK